MNESVTFAGVDTLADLGLRILQGVELSPPEVKEVTVDIPGGDGFIDLSAFSGDVRYGERKMSIPVLLTGSDNEGLEREKTDLMRTFHGQRAPFTLSWDPGYTYTGRAAFEDFALVGHRMTATLNITADPYKYGGTQTWYVNAAGGVAVIIPCGRRKWCPTFQVERDTLVTHNGQSWTVPPGASKVTELYLDPGDNLLILNSDPGYGISAWTDFTGMTWAELAARYPRWYQVNAGGSPRQTALTWADLSGDTWADFDGKRWIELMHDADDDPSYGVYVQTETYEL